MPLESPNRSGPYSRTVTGQWMHADGSGPYAYDPAEDTFTLVGTGGGGGGGGGDASAANQVTQIARATETRDRLPASLGTKTAAASLSTTPAVQPTPTSRAGTIATGGTAQQLAASNANRTGILVQNTSASGILTVAVTTTASATVGAVVQPGAMLVLLPPFCGVGAVSIWGATTGQTFHALEASA